MAALKAVTAAAAAPLTVARYVAYVDLKDKHGVVAEYKGIDSIAMNSIVRTAEGVYGRIITIHWAARRIPIFVTARPIVGSVPDPLHSNPSCQAYAFDTSFLPSAALCHFCVLYSRSKKEVALFAATDTKGTWPKQPLHTITEKELGSFAYRVYPTIQSS